MWKYNYDYSVCWGARSDLHWLVLWYVPWLCFHGILVSIYVMASVWRWNILRYTCALIDDGKGTFPRKGTVITQSETGKRNGFLLSKGEIQFERAAVQINFKKILVSLKRKEMLSGVVSLNSIVEWMIDLNKMFVIRQIFGIKACGNKNATEPMYLFHSKSCFRKTKNIFSFWQFR